MRSMLKNYKELREIDVTPYCEERDGIKYLNWAKCIDLLHEHGAEKVYFEPVPDERTGTSLRMTDVVFSDSKNNTNRCYETRIKVVIDDNEYIMQSPVMNGQNPVKDNSMSQIRVWNSMCRSFVKCVAIHTGLGFNMWLKSEMEPFSNAIPENKQNPSKANIETLTALAKKHNINLEGWLMTNQRTLNTVTAQEVGMMLQAIRTKYGDGE